MRASTFLQFFRIYLVGLLSPHIEYFLSLTTLDRKDIAYTVPDLDCTVEVYVYNDTSTESIACLSADLSNGHTVDQAAVSWVLAVITGLTIIGSAVAAVYGHAITATHISFAALSLLDFMQSQAMIGLSSVRLPPIAQSWTQMFQWTLGVVHVGFLQTLCTWYLRATGGTPSRLLEETSAVSVIVKKRNVDQTSNALFNHLSKRAESSGGEIVVSGIKRMAYRAGIEATNIFMTGYCMFAFIGILLAMGLVTLKFGYLSLAKSKRLPNRFQSTPVKLPNSGRGVILRLATIAIYSTSVLCFWEFTRLDSAGELVLAIFWWAGLTLPLAWITATTVFHVQRTRKAGINPARSPYLNSTRSGKLSFLHAHFLSDAYYFFALFLLHHQAKGIITAVSQSAPVPQAILFVVIDAIMMALTIWLRPYMNKSMNRRGIATVILGFLNSVCVLIFSDIFHGPKMMASVVGVLFCVYNAVYMLVQVIYIFIALIYAIGMKYPESRYRQVSDNRDSHASVSNEGVDLSATERCDAGLSTASSSALTPHPEHESFVPVKNRAREPVDESLLEKAT